MKTKFFKDCKLAKVWLLATVCAIAFGVATMAVVMSGAIANAAADTYSYDESYLTKNVQAPSVATFDKTFTFTFTPYAYNGDTASVSKVPALTDSTQEIPIKVTDGTLDTTTTGFNYATVTGTKATGYIVGLQLSKFMPAASAFPNAGEYTYVVTETGPAADTGWTYSQAQYYLRVYVENGETSLNIEGSTFEQNQDDFGNPIEVLKKEPTWTVSSAGGTTECKKRGSTTNDTYVYNGFTFMNSYEPTSDLKITNHVTGKYADMTLPFIYTISLNNPNLASKTVKASYYGDGITKGTDVSFVFDSTGAASATDINLKDEGYVEFSSLPVGTTYGVAEAAMADYKVEATTVSQQASPVTVTTAETAAGAGISYSKTDNDACIVGSGLGNTSDVTNTRVDIDPTGFIIDIAPYMILIGMPILAIAIWLLIRRRRNNMEE